MVGVWKVLQRKSIMKPEEYLHGGKIGSFLQELPNGLLESDGHARSSHCLTALLRRLLLREDAGDCVYLDLGLLKDLAPRVRCLTQYLDLVTFHRVAHRNLSGEGWRGGE